MPDIINKLSARLLAWEGWGDGPKRLIRRDGDNPDKFPDDFFSSGRPPRGLGGKSQKTIQSPDKQYKAPRRLYKDMKY